MSASASIKSKKKAPQSWRCGDNFLYRLPEPDGDPWNSLLKPLLERDTMQCKAWVDEVQNLLIFAGLFSAVVTAFAVDTFKDLQEDPVVALLAQIAANSVSNGSTAIPRPFTPQASTIRLNLFLFLSLILSLSSALVGIVALQWIREHQQHSNALTPQNVFATLHMRSEALQKWRVPHVFAALPLLLQLSLVFFFAGIVQLLINANTSILIPVVGVMGITIMFLVLTTILPTVQVVTLNHSGLRHNHEIPVPCPFKSPQANAFRRLVTSSETLFKATTFFFAAIYWVIFRFILLLRQIVSSSYCSTTVQLARNPFNRMSGYISQRVTALLRRISPLIPTFLTSDGLKEYHGFDYMLPHIFSYWHLHSWLEFDLAWMSVRDNYFESVCPPDSWLFLHREEIYTSAALYDATQGLCDELTRDKININVNPEPALITAYHCARSLCFPSVGHFDPEDPTVLKMLFTGNQYLATLLGVSRVTPLRPFSETLRPSDFQVLWEETSFIFLHFIQNHEPLDSASRGSHILNDHFAEVYFRLVSQLYSKPYEMDNPQSGHARDVAFEAEDLYVMTVYDAPDQPFTSQWALSITSFFRVLSDRSIPFATISRSFHAHPFFRDYSANFCRQLKHETFTETVLENTIDAVINTLSLINDILDECLENPDLGDDTIHSRSRFIFHSVALYLWCFRYRCINHRHLAPAVEETIERLQNVKNKMELFGVEIDFLSGSDTTSESNNAAEHIPWFTSKWWAELFPYISGGNERGSGVVTKLAPGPSLTCQRNALPGEFRIDMLLPDDIQRNPPRPGPNLPVC